MTVDPRAAALIATRNRRDDLCACLRSLAAQTLRPAEVLIVDASDLRGDEAELYAAAAAPVPVRHVRARRRGLPSQRNQGLGLLGERRAYVFLMDDDLVLEPGYCAALVAALDADPSLGAANGRIVNSQMAAGEERLRWLLRLLLIYGREPGRVLPSGFNTPMWVGAGEEPFAVEVLEGGNCCLRRSAVGELRFDPRYERFAGYAYAEDADFSYALGRRAGLLVVPQARTLHNVSPSARIDDLRFGLCQSFNRALFVARQVRHPLRWPAYLWSMLGIMLLNAATTVARGRSPMRLVGNAVGLALALGGELRRVLASEIGADR